MDGRKFEDEMLFQTAMSTARKLLRDGVIDADEYRKIRAHFLKKYSPIIGSLISENELT